MHFELSEILLLLTAAFFGGILNAVAGGGSFLTLPALMLAGVPALTANATGTVALLPGTIASTFQLRKQLRNASPISLLKLAAISLIGGTTGALLLLFTSNEFFQKLVPYLLLFATAMFALGPRLLRSSTNTEKPAKIAPTPLYILGILTVSIYGGYFNGGLGIMLLALLSLLGHQNLLTMNALKNLLSATLTIIAIVVYAAGNIVDWTATLLMTPTAIADGITNAWLAQRVPTHYSRYTVIATGLTIATLFFIL